MNTKKKLIKKKLKSKKNIKNKLKGGATHQGPSMTSKLTILSNLDDIYNLNMKDNIKLIYDSIILHKLEDFNESSEAFAYTYLKIYKFSKQLECGRFGCTIMVEKTRIFTENTKTAMIQKEKLYDKLVIKLIKHKIRNKNFKEIEILKKINKERNNVREGNVEYIIKYYKDILINLGMNKYYTFIYFEYCGEGDLRKNSSKFDSLEKKLNLALKIAEGLKFLHSIGIIHLDLECKNILVKEIVNDKYIPVITDFGSSLDITEKQATPPLPFRITDPNVFIKRTFETKFKTKNDIWQFGILLLTILTDMSKNLFWRKDEYCIDVGRFEEKIKQLYRVDKFRKDLDDFGTLTSFNHAEYLTDIFLQVKKGEFLLDIYPDNQNFIKLLINFLFDCCFTKIDNRKDIDGIISKLNELLIYSKQSDDNDSVLVGEAQSSKNKGQQSPYDDWDNNENGFEVADREEEEKKNKIIDKIKKQMLWDSLDNGSFNGV